MTKKAICSTLLLILAIVNANAQCLSATKIINTINNCFAIIDDGEYIPLQNQYDKYIIPELKKLKFQKL